MKAIIKQGKVASIKRFHPWVFSGAIQRYDGDPKEGDVIEVVDSKDEFLGVGHWQDGSIAIRICSFAPSDLQEDFWLKRIQTAKDFRAKIGLPSETTNCFRLIHAEGDLCPGLVVDIYGDAAIVQCHSIGMYKSISMIAKAIEDVFGASIQTIYSKSKAALPERFGVGVEDRFLKGDKLKGEVLENGHSFLVDWGEGQKTGFFLDQRNNRQLLGTYAKDKVVLNSFSYSGGFSVYAAKAGAKMVSSVDASKKAIEWADRNMELNKLSQHESFASDVIKYLDTTEAGSFDIMVVDPPAFAKNIRKRHNAVKGYTRLNAIAISKIKSGGLLFTYSCSQVIDKALFENTIRAAALQVGRKARIMHWMSQPADHPVNVFHPEGSYLKGLVVEISD